MTARSTAPDLQAGGFPSEASRHGAVPHGPFVIYDASRLYTRVLNPTPNGIDRLDSLLAGALLAGRGRQPGTLVLGWGGPRLLPASEGLGAVARAERMWGEADRGRRGATALPAVIAWLVGDATRRAGPRHRVVEPRAGRSRAALGALARLRLRRGADPARDAPRDAVCLNASHFPLDWPSHVAWLERRPDVRPVALIHDLLAVDRPELFWSREGERHARRLAFLARRGAGAIVTSDAVERGLRDAMAKAGRRDLPVLRAPPPVAALFHAAPRRDARLEGSPYFVTCGTIEPRKNHLVLARVWRRLVAARGRAAPKLLVIGKRGWLCDDIVAELGHPALAEHVLEVANLASPDYKHLLDHALGLLAPSLAEGFGLPVAEALAAGVPVVASDIPSFREQGGSAVTFLDPAGDDAWHDEILALSRPSGSAQATARARAATCRPVSHAAYVASVEAFLRFGLG